MRLRRFVMACCVVVSATSMFAQAPAGKAKADAISGTWAGELARQGASNPISVTLVLKFDGKSAVTGTVTGLPSPAEVKAGTFNPKTGALKLELGKVGDGAVLLILEGTVVKNEATGRFKGDEAGEFKMARKG